MFEIHIHKKYLHLIATGKLTHQDYIKTLIPELEQAIEKNHQLNVLCEIKDFNGVELQAAWDDLKMGIKHRKDFNKIAIVSDEEWMEKFVFILSKIFGLLMKGEMKFFKLKDKTKAIAWLEKI